MLGEKLAMVIVLKKCGRMPYKHKSMRQKEGPKAWLKYNKEEFSKEIKHVYEDGMKLANKVIENNKILGPIKEVLEERNKNGMKLAKENTH